MNSLTRDMIKRWKAWGTKGGGLWFLLKCGNKNNRAKTSTHWSTHKSESEISRWILLAEVIPVSQKKESNGKQCQERACRISTVQNRCHQRQSNSCGIQRVKGSFISPLMCPPVPPIFGVLLKRTGKNTWELRESEKGQSEGRKHI